MQISCCLLLHPCGTKRQIMTTRLSWSFKLSSKHRITISARVQLVLFPCLWSFSPSLWSAGPWCKDWKRPSPISCCQPLSPQPRRTVCLARSLRLNSGGFHQRRVLFEFLTHIAIELARRHGHRLDAELRQLVLHTRILQRLGNLFMQPLDNFAWSLGGSKHAEPEIVLGIRKPRFDGGRD